MTVQQQQRRPGAALHSENIDIAHGDAKGCEIFEGHGVSWSFEVLCIVEGRYVRMRWDNPRKPRT